MNVIKFESPASIVKRATAQRNRQEEFASVGASSAGASGIKMKFPKRDFWIDKSGLPDVPYAAAALTATKLGLKREMRAGGGSTAPDYDHHVLYDGQKMFRGKQD